jgi:aspartyl-tRNA(Asn)/glutamyl-tRNA(Gln) amidotransferase subunit B
MAKEVLDGIWLANASKDGGPQFRTHADVQSYISGRGLQQVTDQGEIAGVIDQVIAANPDKVAACKAKPAMLGWFVGQVMKATAGKANPQAVNELLRRKLAL